MRIKGVMAASVLLAASAATRVSADTLQLAWPLACDIGRTCWVQNYVDHDAGPGVRDYACGTLTYNTHDGTDIRLRSIAAQRSGVDVLAAADGTVRRTRDGVADRVMRDETASSPEGRECGNGLVIDHGDGWETQYCHMAQGSIRVSPGARVKAGQPLGRVGLSGFTVFPHLHLTVRHRGVTVDPFAFGATPGSCSGGSPLWVPRLREALAYSERSVLNVGFASAPVTMMAIEMEEVGRETLVADAPALVAYVQAIGLKVGDVQHLIVRAPDGTPIVDHAAQPLDRNKAQTLLFAGRKRPPTGWPPGSYAASFAVLRDGKVVLEHSFATTIGAVTR